MVRALVAAVVTALVSACSLSSRSDLDPSPHAVLAVAFENISERYLESLPMDQAALAGLDKLAALEPELNVVRARGAVRLTLGGSEIAVRPEPGPRDALGWAWLTADMIEAARRASPRLRARGIDDVYDAVFGGVTARLDSYTKYAGPAAAKRAREAREGFGGIGITLAIEDEAAAIVSVHDGSPAEKAGVKRDDVITHVNGQPIKGLSQDEIVGRLRGPSGSEIRLTLKRKGQDAPVAIAVTRIHVVPPTVIARRDGSVLSLRVTSFNQRTAPTLDRELRQALRDRERPVRGVVLDLRNNPGGLLDQAVEVADLFIADGKIATTAGRHSDSHQSFDASSGQSGEQVPLIVLINGRSASSAEVVAGALADRGRAVVIGSTTYGKGTVQTIVRLPNSGELTLSWSKLYTPAGRVLHDRGITPAICLYDDESRSNALNAAMRAHRATAAMLTDLPPAKLDCPHGDGELRNIDAEIARRLLAEPALYTAVLASKRPSVAAR
jgi:carboxyl-terminal processing protease